MGGLGIGRECTSLLDALTSIDTRFVVFQRGVGRKGRSKA